MQISDLGYSALAAAPFSQPAAAAPALARPVSAPAAPVDRVEISSEAVKLSTSTQSVVSTETSAAVPECADCANGLCTSCGEEEKTGAEELSEEEQAQIKELKARDQEVRAHEAAHAATGGSFAGAPSFEFETGPDGKRYAVGGEVSIDASPVDGDPQATIDKLETVQAAALAPAEPSDQDRKVAQQAAQALQQARAELASLSEEELAEQTGKPLPGDAPQNETDETDPLAQQQVQQAASTYQKIAALV